MAQDILITPGSGEPQILFRGSGTNDTPIELNVLSSYQSATGSGSALLFEGEQGQLFAITDNLSSGVIFSVADITGLPAIEYNASGELKLGEFSSVLLYDNSSSVGSSGQILSSTGSDVAWVDNPSGTLQSQITQGTNDIAAVSGLFVDYVPYVGATQNLNLGNNKLLLSGVQALGYTHYGYSPTYKVVQVGIPSTYSSTVALCVDVNSVAGGNFAAQNQVIIPSNGFLFPNASGSDFIGVLSRSSDDKLLIGTTLQAGKTAGNIVIDTGGNVGVGTTSPEAQLHVVNNTASDIAVIVQGASAQSANLQEWQNSSTTKLLAVGSDGGLEIPNNVPSSTTNKLYNNSGVLQFDDFYVPPQEKDPSFTYTSGLLTRVDYPTGNYKEFTYNISGVLISVEYVTTNFTQNKTYSYYDDDSLSGITYT